MAEAMTFFSGNLFWDSMEFMQYGRAFFSESFLSSTATVLLQQAGATLMLGAGRLQAVPPITERKCYNPKNRALQRKKMCPSIYNGA